jgi:hypothetical protein
VAAAAAVVPACPRTTVHVVPETAFTVMISPVLGRNALNGVAGKPAPLLTLIELLVALIGAVRVVPT